MRTPKELPVARLSHDEFNFGDWTAEDLGVNDYTPETDSPDNEPDKNAESAPTGTVADILESGEEEKQPEPKPEEPAEEPQSRATSPRQAQPRKGHRKPVAPAATPVNHKSPTLPVLPPRKPPSIYETADITEAARMYTDPNEDPTLADQLAFNSRIMSLLGIRPMSNLSSKEEDRLQQKYDELHSQQSNLRLVTAPFEISRPNLRYQRVSMLYNLTGQVPDLSIDNKQPMWQSTDYYAPYVQLEKDAKNIAHGMKGGSVLRYKSPVREQPVNREGFLVDMMGAKHMALANGTPWTANFVDTNSNTPRSSLPIKELYESQMPATHTFETEFVLQAMLLIATKHRTERANIVNEATYRRDKGRENLYEVATVGWNTAPPQLAAIGRRVATRGFGVKKNPAELGMHRTVSGL